MQQGSNWKRDGREGGKSHEAEACLPHRETAKRPENSNAGWKKTARFAHGEKPIINHSFSHDLSGLDFKSGFVFEGRMTDSRMMKCGFSILFVAAMVLFRRVSLGHHRSGTVFSYSGSDLERTATRAPLFPTTRGRMRFPVGLAKPFPFAYFRVRDATNIRMNPALSFWIAIPGDPVWDNAEALNQFFRMKQEAPAFPRECARAIGRKSRCGLIGWLFAANANGVQCLDFSHPFPRAVTARAGSRYQSFLISRDNLFDRDFTASIAETA